MKKPLTRSEYQLYDPTYKDLINYFDLTCKQRSVIDFYRIPISISFLHTDANRNRNWYAKNRFNAIIEIDINMFKSI